MNIHKLGHVLHYKKHAITGLLVVLIALSYSVKPVKAVTQNTLSGSCGILANFNYNGWNNLAASVLHQPNLLTKSAIGIINFDTARLATELSVISNYGSATNNISETTVKTLGTFTFASFDSDTGIYKYTSTLDSSGQVILFSVIPVNSGNSYLISGQVPALDVSAGPAISGICQKI